MKKFIYLFTILFFIACSNNKNTGNVILSGKIEGLKNGKIFIKQLKDSTIVNIDTIVFNGEDEFETNFQIEEAQMLYLNLDRGTTTSIDNDLMFFAEPGKMTFNTTLKEFYVQSKFTGSKNQKVFENFLSMKEKLNDENLDIIEKELKSFQFKNTTIDPELEVKKERLLIKKYQFITNFSLVNNKYEVSPYIALTEIPDAHLSLLDTINNTMSKKVANSNTENV